jgi:hypothetical protein
VFQVMSRTYRGLLEAIVRRDYDVFSGRVRLSRWHKLWLALQALPLRWGWPPPPARSACDPGRSAVTASAAGPTRRSTS